MSTKQTLRDFLSFRLRNHKQDSVFWMYLIVIVCGVGAAGILSNVLPALIAWDMSKLDTQSLAVAIYTLFPSLLVTSCADILLPDNVSKPIRMLSIVLVVFALLWMMLCAKLSAGASVIFGLLGCVLGVLTWVVAHGEDPALTDGEIVNQNISTGGEDDKPVAGSEGEFHL